MLTPLLAPLRPIVPTLVIAAALLALTACKDQQVEARKSLDAYLEAERTLDAEAAATWSAEADREAVAAEVLPQLEQAERELYVEAVVPVTSHEVTGLKVEDSTATATVEATYVPSETLWPVLLQYRQTPKEDRAEAAKAVAEAMKKGEPELTTETWTYVLVREPEGWRVHHDLEQRRQIDQALDQARTLARQGLLAEARAKLEAARKMDFEGSKPEQIAASAKDVERAIAQIALDRQVSEILTTAHTTEDAGERHAAVAKLKLLVEEQKTKGADVTQLERRIAALERELERKKEVAARAQDVEITIDGIERDGDLTTISGSVANKSKGALAMIELALDFIGADGTSVERISYVPFAHESLEAGTTKPFRYMTPSAPAGWDGKIAARVVDLK